MSQTSGFSRTGAIRILVHLLPKTGSVRYDISSTRAMGRGREGGSGIASKKAAVGVLLKGDVGVIALFWAVGLAALGWVAFEGAEFM
jgi:hypothetical protein